MTHLSAICSETDAKRSLTLTLIRDGIPSGTMGEDDRGKGPEGGHQSVGPFGRAGSIAEPDVRAVSAVIERPRRRMVLEAAIEQGSVTTRDLATPIAACVHDVAPGAVTDEQRQHLAISLHHEDVPKLVATDVLDADENLDRIRPGPKAHLVRSVLQGIAEASHDTANRGRID